MIHIHTTRQGLLTLKKMLPWLRTRGLGSRERRPGVLQGEGKDARTRQEANDMQTSFHVLLWPKDTTILNSIYLKQVSILDDLVGEEASMSMVRGGARR